MQPRAQRPQHEHDAARERPGIVLAQVKFHRVERCLDGERIDATICQSTDRVGNQPLDLAGIGRIDTLEADGEHGLPQPVVEAAAGQAFAEAGIDQRLIERRGRIADQDMLQDVEAERGFDVDDLIDHPIHRNHRFLGRVLSGLRLLFGGAGCVGASEPLGRAKARLQGYVSIDLDPVEFA